MNLRIQDKVKGYTIEYCEPQAMPDGTRVIIAFEQAGKVIVSCIDDQTRIQYLKE